MTPTRLLLDTHVWVWYLVGDVRLPKRHRRAIENGDVELYLSPISIWETHLLIERGRLPVDRPPREWIARARNRLPLQDAPVTAAIAVRSRELRSMHEDPADRFLAATALEMGLALATVDERLQACAELECF